MAENEKDVWQEIVILRLNHRPERDKRTSSHVCLVARAFGADRVIYSGLRDGTLENGVLKVVSDWGGNFSIEHTPSWRRCIKGYKTAGFVTVHLTMYGLPLAECTPKLQRISAPLLVVVGGSKVPREIYDLCDFNVSVTHQPHSEIAALAVFLEHVGPGITDKNKFEGAKHRIVPQAHGKTVLKIEGRDAG